jgi:hypothetical protein
MKNELSDKKYLYLLDNQNIVDWLDSMIKIMDDSAKEAKSMQFQERFMEGATAYRFTKRKVLKLIESGRLTQNN